MNSIAQTKVLEIRTELAQTSSLENFKRGWRTIHQRHSYGASAAYKAAMGVSAIALTLFTFGSVIMGILAFKEGLGQFRETGRAPIIGHLSEWSIQGLLCLYMYLRVLGEVNSLGKEVKKKELYHTYLMSEKLSIEIKNELYEEYLRSLEEVPCTTFVSLPLLPQPPEMTFSEEEGLGSKLQIDLLLKKEYPDLEEQLNRLKYPPLVREGWRISMREKKTCHPIAMKAFLGISGGFVLLNSLNYIFGICWSAEQAVRDYKDGKSPSIGGHSLEWSVELLALLNGTWSVLSELSNVGRVQALSDLFQKKIKEMEPGLLKERLYGEMRRLISRIPEGDLFEKPFPIKQS